ncbi:COX15/CtaA family protein [Cellulomonas telluris]|uniref:COX15/CtaA family protein n=1 Tax=Cellulomonas telluris TaxID=2306636 RepID=UPI0010A88821|nr:COX15/CtaA family protein [Cellulomonas telluris]
MRTPFDWLAEHVRFGYLSLQAAAATALAASVMIVVTGSVVRVTGSGLGCDTWPRCTAESLVPTPEMGVHGVIEFGNRLLTVVLCVIVGWLIVVARLQRTPVRQVTRSAWVQFWVIVLNAVVGGITVWTRLSPYVVAAHFLAAMLLVTVTAVTWHEVRTHDQPRQPAPPDVRHLAAVLVLATAVLVVLGTLVTGTGPHAGDSADVPRMPFDWTAVTALHAVTAAAVGVAALVLWFRTRQARASTVHRRATAYLIVFAAQGAIGGIQVATRLPEPIVVLHLLGAALVWVGAIRLLLDTRDHPPRTRVELGSPATAPARSAT